jgi:DNA gyrase inhibitor GyrI
VSGFQISEPVRVDRKDTPVMFMRASADTPEAIQQAWARFEGAVGLKGRKFFGAFDSSSREYRVCAQLKEGDDLQALGFEAATLPGGAYLCVRLLGEPPAVYEHIPAAWSELVKRGTSDGSRPSIEFYRSRYVIDLLLPIV